MFQRCAPGARRWWQPCRRRADLSFYGGALLSTDRPSTRLMAMR